MRTSLHQNLFEIQNYTWKFGERILAFQSCNSPKFYTCQANITTSLFWWEALAFVFVILFILHKLKFSSYSPIQFLYWVTSAANRLRNPVLWMPSFTEFSGSKSAQEIMAEPINTTHISNTVQWKRRLRKMHKNTFIR